MVAAVRPIRPARAHSSRTHHSGGSAAKPISGTQDKMASQPIMAAISNPTVTVLPCSECAYGAASPSGTM
jgi:hypothetical protein